jgi:hypothetical protein
LTLTLAAVFIRDRATTALCISVATQQPPTGQEERASLPADTHFTE